MLFDFDQAVIRPDGEKDLQALLEELKQLEDFRLTVEGHTDSKGTDAYNRDLSRRRADSVAAWLASASPALPLPQVRAYGETRPAASNEKPDGSDDPAGRQLNRRVEIIVRATTGN
ncbi:OmpA family protein [Devosia soli]|uniref:OmpA family protein n=1 Tax=Devosia soli TaxID=361041 RepID=UPI0013792A8D